MTPLIRIGLVAGLCLLVGGAVLAIAHLSAWWEVVLVLPSVALGCLGAMKDPDAEP